MPFTHAAETGEDTVMHVVPAFGTPVPPLTATPVIVTLLTSFIPANADEEITATTRAVQNLNDSIFIFTLLRLRNLLIIQD
jgi:hypothetical protein